MRFYKTKLWFSDGRYYEDLWVNKDDAYSYISNAEKYKGCIRAEMLVFEPDEDDFKYEVTNCLYEYDVDGKYYYDVA